MASGFLLDPRRVGLVTGRVGATPDDSLGIRSSRAEGEGMAVEIAHGPRILRRERGG
jgi:hypothetical protein